MAFQLEQPLLQTHELSWGQQVCQGCPKLCPITILHFLAKEGTLGAPLAVQWLCLSHTEPAMLQNENRIFASTMAPMKGNRIWLGATDQTCGIF